MSRLSPRNSATGITIPCGAACPFINYHVFSVAQAFLSGQKSLLTCDIDTIWALTPHHSLIVMPPSCSPLVIVALPSCLKKKGATVWQKHRKSLLLDAPMVVKKWWILWGALHVEKTGQGAFSLWALHPKVPFLLFTPLYHKHSESTSSQQEFVLSIQPQSNYLYYWNTYISIEMKREPMWHETKVALK